MERRYLILKELKLPKPLHGGIVVYPKDINFGTVSTGRTYLSVLHIAMRPGKLQSETLDIIPCLHRHIFFDSPPPAPVLSLPIYLKANEPGQIVTYLTLKTSKQTVKVRIIGSVLSPIQFSFQQHNSQPKSRPQSREVPSNHLDSNHTRHEYFHVTLQTESSHAPITRQIDSEQRKKCVKHRRPTTKSDKLHQPSLPSSSPNSSLDNFDAPTSLQNTTPSTQPTMSTNPNIRSSPGEITQCSEVESNSDFDDDDFNTFSLPSASFPHSTQQSLPASVNPSQKSSPPIESENPDEWSDSSPDETPDVPVSYQLDQDLVLDDPTAAVSHNSSEVSAPTFQEIGLSSISFDPGRLPKRRGRSMNLVNLNPPLLSPRTEQNEGKMSGAVSQMIQRHSQFHNDSFPLWSPEIERQAKLSLTETQLFTDPWMFPIPDSTEFKEAIWLRPSQIVAFPPHEIKIMNNARFMDVHQAAVHDCSVNCSLNLLALHKARTGTDYLSHLIHPQDSTGTPIYNPNGHYYVKLYFNGGWRAVEIDDRFPVSNQSAQQELTMDTPKTLCCAFSMDRTEFWVSILEKAYLKMRGHGYDFPGSRTEIDLFIFAQCIPGPSWDIEKSRELAEFHWKVLLDGYKSNTCLASVSTARRNGDSNKVGSNGLVSNHAYAVLDVLQLSDGTKLLKLKNPWATDRWTGSFNPNDVSSWTDVRLREANYDRKAAAEKDDGVFFIRFEDMVMEFSHLYHSYSQRPFRHKKTFPFRWEVGKQTEQQNLSVFNACQFLLYKRKSQQIWLILEQFLPKGDLPKRIEDEPNSSDPSDALCGMVVMPHQSTSDHNQPPKRPDHERVWKLSCQGPITVEKSMMVTTNLNNDFEGYFTVIPHVSPKTKVDCDFLLHICSTDIIDAEEIKEGPAEVDKVIEDSCTPTPLLFETAIRAAPTINLSADPNRPKSKFVTHTSSPTSLRLAMRDILPSSLIPFFHASAPYFSPQYRITLSPKYPNTPRKQPLIETMQNGLYFDSNWNEFTYVFQTHTETPMFVASKRYTQEPKKGTNEQLSVVSSRQEWSTNDKKPVEHELITLARTFSQNVEQDLLMMVSPSFDRPHVFGSFKVICMPPLDFRIKVTKLKEEWNRCSYTLFLHGSLNQSHPLHFGLTVTETTNFTSQFIFISTKDTDIFPSTWIYQKDEGSDTPTLQSAVESTERPWPNYTLFLESDFAGSTDTAHIPSKLVGTKQFPFGDMRNTKEVASSLLRGGGRLVEGEFVMRTTVKTDETVNFVCFLWSDQPLNVLEKI
ncbi:putative MIT domain protein [Blattamonas nauphoetae]|uniref:MIT domain protein n=1 Tax=Blattamonas nauphoetae TaxID=2049346 RepID=A0ABQ9XU77_9EUKA|nr:putative MIT domain protein [Blattamonas nauphoetae]